MKVNLIPAYLEESSITIRVSTKDAGKLLAGFQDGDFPKVLESLVNDSGYTGQDRRDLLSEKLTEFADVLLR